MNSKYKTVKYKKNKPSNIEDLVSIEEPLEMVVRYKKENEWVRRTVKFGSGLVDNLEKPTKRCIVGSNLLQYILNGHALFENLNTGYGAEWERYPNIFNKDITMMLVAFSHVYKNRLAKEFVKI